MEELASIRQARAAAEQSKQQILIAAKKHLDAAQQTHSKVKIYRNIHTVVK